MARELPDRSLRYVRDNFDDAYILGQVQTGNMTAEDAAAVFDLALEEGAETAPETIKRLGEIAGALADDIVDVPNTFVGQQTLFADVLYDSALEDEFNSASFLEELANQLDGLLTAEISTALLPIQSEVAAQTEKIDAVPRAQVVAMENQTAELEGTISGWFEQYIRLSNDQIIQSSEGQFQDITDLLNPIAEVTEDVVNKVTNFATALREVIPALGDALTDALESAQDFVVSGIKDAAGSILSSFFDGMGLDAVERIEPIIQMLEEEFDTSPELRKLTAPGLLPAFGIGALAAGMAIPMILSSVGSTMLAPFAEKLRQRMNALARPSLITPNEVVIAMQRDDIGRELAQNILDRQGLPDDQVDALRLLTLQKADIGTLVRWQAREIITPLEFYTMARQIGWTRGPADNYVEEFEGPPPIGDLIRMVVRDAFEQTVVDEGKLSEGFDDFPVEYAKQLGLTDFWSEKYWQAHWMLPSLGQGFEMLHRLPNWQGDEGSTRLEALFKAADLAPGYWDDMKALSYRPYTRVDVRRMNAFGVLDEAQVKEAYKQIGYDEEKAGTLTDFTLAYNDSVKKGSKSAERDLSKSDVIGMYNDGVLDADTTRGYLTALGYDEAEATVLIEREDIQEMRRERKLDISNIIDQAKIKALTYEAAQDRLAALDLTRTETNKALADLARVSQTRTRTPTKADLDEWLGLRLITEGDYAEELRTLGYADRYVALYVEATTAETESDLLAEEAKAARRREPRSVSKSNLDSLYQAQIIDLLGYTEGLQTLGYRQADIANLLEQQTLKLDERLRDEAERLARGEEAAVRERLPSRGLLGKLFLKELIDTDAYEEGLTLLGFSPENIELLSKLIGARRIEDASEPEGAAQQA